MTLAHDAARTTAATAASAMPAPRAWPEARSNEELARALSYTVVPHTHWDREWYLPFQQFRMRLARTVDAIIDTLETDPSFRHFTLDGQSVILEDYAELRPERLDRLRALVAAGRIATGPSYVLPDEFLASEEALVRNLLLGRAVCERFGGRPMPVGYLPDTFGHVAQLPQILQGFGIDTFVFWRGLGDEAERLGAVFEWQAPDGTPVLAIRQLGGYGSAAELGRWAAGGLSVHAEPDRWPEVAAHRFVRQLDSWGEPIRRTGIPEVLLCNGADHLPIQADVPALLDHARAVHPGLTVEIGTYESYVERIRPYLASAPMEVHRGELLGSREIHALRGINSARMYLKQLAHDASRDVLVAETLASLAVLAAEGTYAYPRAELGLAWRELLRNMPHDSISGCSVDEVHRDMLARFATTAQIADRVRREALAALAGTAEPWSYRPVPAAERSIVNPLPWERLAAVELPLPASLASARSLVARTDDGDVPVQLVADCDGKDGGERRAFVVASVGGFGGRTFRLVPGTATVPAGEAARAIDGRSIENGVYRVEALPSGALRITEQGSGRVHEGQLVFEDVADRGDEYDFCPVEGEAPWTSEGVPARVRVTAGGPLVAELHVDLVARLPRALRRDRRGRTAATVACRISSTIRVVAGSDRIGIVTTVDNRARDHRLRVRFAAPSAGPTARAEGHFDVVERPIQPLSSGEGWAEPPSPTQHTSGFVSAGEVTVVGHGLPEYETVPRPDGGVDVALTLLRCVGWLSRGDLATRPGHAGPDLPTPDAQCQGTHTFRYALRLGEPLPDVALSRLSADERIGWAIGPAGADPSGLVGIGGDPVAFSALKGADDGDGIVLRLHNPGDEPARVALGGRFAEALLCRLDEQPSDEGTAPGPVLAPREIGTFRLRS